MSRAKPGKKFKTAKPKKSHRTGLFVFATVIIIVLGVAAYISSQPPRPAGGIGDNAPDFTLPMVTSTGLSDQTVALSSLRGKVVVLEFMVSWCHVCQDMAPSIEFLHQKYQGQGVVFLSVAGTQSGATAKTTAEFIRAYNSTWTYALDTDDSVFAAYKVEATPTILVLDGSGKILSRFQGALPTDALASAIDLALS